MRILEVITGSGLGGAQSVVACLANALCGAHEVVVVAGEGDGALFRMLDARVHRVRVPALRRAISPRSDAAALAALRRIGRRFRPDVVHLHSSKAGLLGRLAFPAGRTVYTVHGFDSVRLAHRRLLPLERWMQRRCAAIVAVSHYDEVNLRREGICRNLCCVRNGIPDVAAGGAAGAADWPVPQRYARTVLCIARVSPPKKHPSLPRRGPAAARLRVCVGGRRRLAGGGPGERVPAGRPSARGGLLRAGRPLHASVQL